MSSRLTASALVGLGLVVMTAVAQPPASTPKPADKKPAEKKADPLDGLIGAALLHDADVQVARAKVQLADAELAKARQAVTMKVIAAHAAVQVAKSDVASAEFGFEAAIETAKRTVQPERIEPVTRQERIKLEAAKSKLAQLETELKLITGGGAKAAAGWDDLDAVHRGATWKVSCMACHAVPVGKGATDPAVQAGLDWLAGQELGAERDAERRTLAALLALAGREPVKGPMADRIRAALDKPVKLGAKGARVEFDDALEVFKKDAGLDVPVRNGFRTSPVTSLGEELPVGAWFQMFADANPDLRFVVREYGLLVTRKESTPPDAISVFDFWRQKPAAKEEPKK